jgi:hypothetical protein
MGFEDEVNLSRGLAVSLNGRFKRTCELTSSIVRQRFIDEQINLFRTGGSPYEEP